VLSVCKGFSEGDQALVSTPETDYILGPGEHIAVSVDSSANITMVYVDGEARQSLPVPVGGACALGDAPVRAGEGLTKGRGSETVSLNFTGSPRSLCSWVKPAVDGTIVASGPATNIRAYRQNYDNTITCSESADTVYVSCYITHPGVFLVGPGMSAEALPLGGIRARTRSFTFETETSVIGKVCFVSLGQSFMTVNGYTSLGTPKGNVVGTPGAVTLGNASEVAYPSYAGTGGASPVLSVRSVAAVLDVSQNTQQLVVSDQFELSVDGSRAIFFDPGYISGPLDETMRLEVAHVPGSRVSFGFSVSDSGKATVVLGGVKVLEYTTAVKPNHSVTFGGLENTQVLRGVVFEDSLSHDQLLRLGSMDSSRFWDVFICEGAMQGDRTACRRRTPWSIDT
jgi:hypothetical protein